MSVHKPTILPEHSGPPDFSLCRQCELHQHKTRTIWGEGNPGAPVYVILDNPGAREDNEGRPFLCGTRETLQQAAYEAGLGADELYVTYLLKCRPRRAYDKPKARSVCINFLGQQLKQGNPQIIFALGNTVCQSVWDDQKAQVKDLRGQVHLIDGYEVITSYHPLAVRRRPALYKYFLADWQLVVSQLHR
ncbi:MAG: uracil-DNA glycosylase [Firmicutes bacterium]|nr:uracil-DNA glycosylase [Bacillota bacterium]